MGICEMCPNRYLANLQRSSGEDFAALFRALGSDDIAQSIQTKHEAQALEIENRGCPWWWGLTEKNSATGVSREFFDCGVTHIAKLLLDQGAKTEEALQTAQSFRNVIEVGFKSLRIAQEPPRVLIQEVLGRKLELGKEDIEMGP